jgi:hypothetical protein
VVLYDKDTHEAHQHARSELLLRDAEGATGVSGATTRHTVPLADMLRIILEELGLGIMREREQMYIARFS